MTHTIHWRYHDDNDKDTQRQRKDKDRKTKKVTSLFFCCVVILVDTCEGSDMSRCPLSRFRNYHTNILYNHFCKYAMGTGPLLGCVEVGRKHFKTFFLDCETLKCSGSMTQNMKSSKVESQLMSHDSLIGMSNLVKSQVIMSQNKQTYLEPRLLFPDHLSNNNHPSLYAGFSMGAVWASIQTAGWTCFGRRAMQALSGRGQLWPMARFLMAKLHPAAAVACYQTIFIIVAAGQLQLLDGVSSLFLKTSY